MSRSPSPVNFKKQQAAYVTAERRNRCQNCSFVQVLPDQTGMKKPSFLCPHVGFTGAWAICKHYARKGATPA